LQKLNNLNAGLTFADIENIQKMEETSELLIRMGLKENDLLSSIKNILVERHILLEKINTQAYILSAIGQKFFDDLKNLYSIDTSD